MDDKERAERDLEKLDRIMAEFEAAGYRPELQSRFHCNPMFGGCAPVQNIIATKPGLSSLMSRT